VRQVHRRYRPGTLVLETVFETHEGEAAIIDFMPQLEEAHHVVRIVEGRRGRVPMRMELAIRFDYGSIIPWVRHVEPGISAIAGPDRIRLHTDVELRGVDYRTVADFEVAEGQRRVFDMVWHLSHLPVAPPCDALRALDETTRWWQDWSSRCPDEGEWTEVVARSLITLKALTYAPTGGVVAASTTSLPEQPGGVRNWDYRYCWLRDATFTLMALMHAGYLDEARAWREWLIRAVAGEPSKIQIMYGLAGERRLTELELPWLPGYENARPVRIGNSAVEQFQLDVYGETLDALHQGLNDGIDPTDDSRRISRGLLEFLESSWQEPDEGIWEVRGPRRHFTHSKVMAWVAFDRAVKAVKRLNMEGSLHRWTALRDEIHAQVCRDGYNPDLGTFVQSYGSNRLDASLLMIPLVGFLPPTDPRVQGTIDAVQKHLTTDGFVHRYEPDPAVDGLPPGEGVFLLCTFWLADCLAMTGRYDDARRTYERLLSIRNDVGLLSEAYDPASRSLLGNFPQAFSHVGLINTALNLRRGAAGPAGSRGKS
jgi:GH15 family glucan-1,4-alpha-glucosidase